MRTQTTGSESVEMYLKTVAELGGADAPVPLAQIADRLEVTPVSAGEMMKRLGSQGLIERVPYKGVSLTPEGQQAALSVIRRQRLWECFLVDHLQLNWAGAYEMACRLEHATSNVVAEALDRFLDHPQTCPHGNPIPTQDGTLATRDGVPLSSLSVGRIAEIRSIITTRTEIYAYLQRRNLLPGQQIKIMAIAPLQGPMTLALEKETVTLGQALAELILVHPLDDAADTAKRMQTEALTLDQLRPGELGTVVYVGGQGAYRRRFMEMGLVRGETVMAERVAPLGDPVEYRVKGYHLSLRREEARHIQIVRVQETNE